jgi:hypothetical protein
MADSDEDRGSYKKTSTENRGWSSTSRILSDRTIERLGNDVCGLHRAQGDNEHEFFGLASKLRTMISPSLASKLVITSFLVWPQNQGRRFLSI